jgi:hypothetical protein
VGNTELRGLVLFVWFVMWIFDLTWLGESFGCA